ncbi:hypothetical protein CDL12_21888 [Handroanthus impetiginosus]|uniref:Uncharacterized protein n=1 Tax=Handroanthus impetiginosus TaxID=429701 RepID=A0A2G9GJV0_9LAMI|nr:hypothetical protein CDL12_21888 [Handroanthus impetiginosus]
MMFISVQWEISNKLPRKATYKMLDEVDDLDDVGCSYSNSTILQKATYKMLDEVDDLDDVGCSYSNSSGPWKCLVRLSELLSQGRKMFELEYLVNEIEEPDILADHLPPEFINKGKRSPRRRKVVFVPFLSHVQSLDDAAAITGKKTGLKLIFKTTLRTVSAVICTQQPVSKKIAIKKPCSENLDKNPCKRTMNSEEEEGTSKKRAKKSSAILDPAPDLPDVFKNRIIGCGGDPESVVLVIQKELKRTDLRIGHGRLSIPYKKVRNEFLKPSEVDQSNTEKGGIKTALIQPSLEECEINLRNWKSNTEYVLVRDWNEVCTLHNIATRRCHRIIVEMSTGLVFLIILLTVGLILDHLFLH